MKNKTKKFLDITLLIFFLICTDNCIHGREVLKLATTTSVVDSGLFELLIPKFEQMYGITVRVIAVGTGKALKLGSGGDVDVILVHSPEKEKEFMNKDLGIQRKKVMENDFIVVGPSGDPGGCRDLEKAGEVFRRISEKRCLFVSRADYSGTHLKELEIWEKAGISPEGKWYLEVGQGMGATLQIANEKLAYCLVDRGTYLSYRDKVDLRVLHEGDPLLINPYHIIAVNPLSSPDVNHSGAKVFIDWITSEEGRELIDGFKRGGKQLFTATLILPSPLKEGGLRSRLKPRPRGSP